MEARMLVPFPEKPRTQRADPAMPRGEDPLAPLLARVAEGDEAAFRALYDAASPRVLGLALRILRDRAAAEEAVVDVFAQVWRQAARYDASKSAVATWITTLARTRAIDLARIQKRRTRGEVAIDERVAVGLLDRAPGPAAKASGGEHAARIRHALDSLPREQRTAIELAFFGGLSHTEVAAHLDSPLGTVKTRIRSALATLRTTLSAVEGEIA